MFEIKNTIYVNQQNFQKVMYQFLLGYKLSNYNSECFSLNEVRRYVVCEKSMDLMLSEMIDAGYSSKDLLAPIEKECRIKLGNLGIQLNQEIDQDFNIMVNGSVVEFGKSYLEVG